MTAALHELLARHVARRREQNLKNGLSEAASPWLFATETGGPLDDSRVRKAFARTLKRAKLPSHFTPHSARHSFATHHLNMGTSLKWVSEELGHASVEVTANWYSWALPTADRSIADRLDSALASRSETAIGEGAGQSSHTAA